MTPENRSALDWLMAPAEELQQTFDITLPLGRRLSSLGNGYPPLGDWRLNSRQVAALGLSLTDGAGQILTVTLIETLMWCRALRL